jgi:hypothetical protein
MFHQILRGLAQGPFVSSGLVRRVLTDGLRGQAGYRLAKGLAATGTARVLLSPIAYYTADPGRFADVVTPAMEVLIPDQVPFFWRILLEAAAEDGIELLCQPEETVTQGLFTAEAYAAANHVERRDFEHHNAAYGALILTRAVALARRG